MLINIFESNLALPKKVCIVAPGANGAPYQRLIPNDYYQIAVSKAVLCKTINPRAWVTNFVNQDWYPKADSSFSGIRIFRKSSANILLGERPIQEPIYYFDPLTEVPDKIHAVHRRPVDGLIRSGGSISGIAIQVAYNLGATDILLCGVDMSGDGYWDGTANPQNSHGEVWSFTPRLQNLINMLSEEKSIRFATMSPTKLILPRWGEAHS
jgi:hypothetical protein